MPSGALGVVAMVICSGIRASAFRCRLLWQALDRFSYSLSFRWLV